MVKKSNTWIVVIIILVIAFLYFKPDLSFMGATYETGRLFQETNYGDEKIDWDNVYYLAFEYKGCIPEDCVNIPYVMINNKKYDISLQTCESYEFVGTSPLTQKYEIEMDKSFFKDGIYQFSSYLGCCLETLSLPKYKNDLIIRYDVECLTSSDCKDVIRGTVGECIFEDNRYRCTNFPQLNGIDLPRQSIEKFNYLPYLIMGVIILLLFFIFKKR